MSQFQASAKITGIDHFSNETAKYPINTPSDTTKALLIKFMMNNLTNLASKGDKTAQLIIEQSYIDVAEHMEKSSQQEGGRA